MEYLFTNEELQAKKEVAKQENKEVYFYIHDIDYTAKRNLHEYDEIVETKLLFDENCNPILDKNGKQKTVKIKEKVIVGEKLVDGIEIDAFGEEHAVKIQDTEDVILKKTVAELVVAPKGYYICIKDNITRGEINPEYISNLRIQFEKEFIKTSLGYFRLNPKGYANAQQAIDIVNNVVKSKGSLTEEIASMMIFYEEPVFEEINNVEEWLFEHQYSPSPMTIEKWSEFYIEFTTLYAQKQYQSLTQNV